MAILEIYILINLYSPGLHLHNSCFPSLHNFIFGYIQKNLSEISKKMANFKKIIYITQFPGNIEKKHIPVSKNVKILDIGMRFFSMYPTGKIILKQYSHLANSS